MDEKELKRQSLIRVVDDDEGMRASLKFLLEGEGWLVRTYASARDYLENDFALQPGCLILDVQMPGMTGLELQELLNGRELTPGIVFLSAHSTVPMAVRAIREGAVNFLMKPVDEEVFVDAVAEAVQKDLEERSRVLRRSDRLKAWNRLTVREMQVAREVARGRLNKVTAQTLGISERTVQLHRANLLHKLGLKSAAELAALLIEAGILKPGEAA